MTTDELHKLYSIISRTIKEALGWHKLCALECQKCWWYKQNWVTSTQAFLNLSKNKVKSFFGFYYYRWWTWISNTTPKTQPQSIQCKTQHSTSVKNIQNFTVGQENHDDKFLEQKGAITSNCMEWGATINSASYCLFSRNFVPCKTSDAEC